MKFNEKQQRAIDTRKNCLISAGAGSGKTKVLTQKIYELIENGEVNPANLLVLTFTNAAAHSMKTKIISTFKEKKSPKASNMSSAHIETFDAFASFLVKKYPHRLNVNPNFEIVDQTIIDIKTKEIIIEVLEDYYEKDDKVIGDMLYNLGYCDDDKLVDTLYKIKIKLDSYPRYIFNDFFDNYEEKYLKKDVIETNLIKLINEDCIKPIRRTIYSHDISVLDEGKMHIFYELCRSIKDDVDSIEKDPSNDNFIKKYFDICLKVKDENFKLHTNCKVSDEAKRLNKFLKYNIKDNLPIENWYKIYNSIDDQVNYILSFKNQVLKTFEILDKVYYELDQYKSSSSSYTFNDIYTLASSLLYDEEYKDIKEELQKTYKYILVDEYQDTNDLQEEFLNTLGKAYGNKFFFVGDIKQSIYRFRNANPELFTARKDEYKKNSEICEVIDMNNNYRSLEIVLNCINEFFSSRNDSKMGGIIYNENEKLIYDKNQNIYDVSHLKTDKLGFTLIDSEGIDYSSKNRDKGKDIGALIIKDIKNKINNHYQVLDFDYDGKLVSRDVTYKDFAILCSKNEQVDDYYDVFKSFNIPANINGDLSYIDIVPLRAIESLLRMCLAIQNKDYNSLPHLYASLARSFIFNYSDEEIYKVLNNKKDRLNNIWNSEIYLKLAKFNKNNREVPLSIFLTNIIKEFDIANKLVSLGNYEDNISFLEYYYSLVKSYENNGEDLESFIELLSKIKDNKSDIKAKNLVSNYGSVEITTIHKSKGLEYKVVYVPIEDTRRRPKEDKNKFDLSKDFGLLYDKKSFNEKLNKTILSLYLDRINKSKELEEYERLVYVALTRAKEEVVFVKPRIIYKKTFSDDKKGEYYLDDYVFKFFHKKIEFNDNYLSVLLREDILQKEDIEVLKNCVDIFNIIGESEYNNLLKDKIKKFDADSYFKVADKLNKRFSAFKMKKYPFFDSDKEEVDFNLDIPNNLDSFYKNLLLSLRKLKLCVNSTLLFKLLSNYDYNNLSKEIDLKDKRNKYFYNELNSILPIFNDEESLASFVFSQNQAEDNYVLEFIDRFDLLNNKELSHSLHPLFTEKIKEEECYTLYDYKDRITKLDNNSNKKIYDKLEINDDEIVLSEIKNKTASHKAINEYLPFNVDLESKLKEGIRLHALLESIDYKSKDTSFILNDKDKEKIKRVINLPIFDNVKNAHVYQEYQYVLDNVEGSIDLLLIYDDHIDIIDYKTKNIDDEAYKNQLNVYRNAINRLFNSSESNKEIRTYLLSILDAKIEEIKE